MELHLRRFCDKRIVACRGECGRNITANTVMLVKSFGDVSFYDRQTGKHTIKKGNHYIHFEEECLKNYDSVQTNHFYDVDEDFQDGKLHLNQKSKEQMSQTDLEYLSNIGVRV